MINYQPIFSAASGALLATLFVHCFPTAELQLFVQGAAKISSLFTHTSAISVENGWLLPLHHQTVLVSKACSGVTFFIITCTLLCWHIARHVKSTIAAVSIGFISAFILAITVNALRIVCLVQAHRWLIPLVPESYAAFAHMLVGAAVFLPTLIALNTLLEFYGYSKERTPAQIA